MVARRNSSLRVVSPMAVLCLLGILLVPGNRPARAAEPCAVTSSAPAAVERSVLCLLNAERTRRGLGRLRRSSMLEEAASWQSRDMVGRRYFEHERRGGPGLVLRIRRTGYLHNTTSWIVGENIEWAEGELGSPENLVKGWMSSPPHRENILNRRYHQIGIGLTSGAPTRYSNNPAVTVTTDFGFRSFR